MSKNENAQDRNNESMLYVHALYYLFANGPIKKDEFEQKIFAYLKDNNLFFPTDLEVMESRESRSRPERIYQQLRNLAKSNKSLSPSYFVKETETHYELAKPIFNVLKTLFKNHVHSEKGSKTKRPEQYANMDNVILYGPPGTGKTFLAKRENGGFDRTIVQFHPSYSYENFVQGERLITIGDLRLTQVIDGPLMISYRKATDTPIRTKAKVLASDGASATLLLPVGLLSKYDFSESENLLVALDILSDSSIFHKAKVIAGDRIQLGKIGEKFEVNDVIEICLKFESWGEMRPQIIIIDEINRADIAKVFGELLNALADAGDKGEGSWVQLQYSGEKFIWPGNMRLIGTMNTADRSIGEIDQAIKRRFRFVEVKPNKEIFIEKSKINFATGLRELIENTVDKRKLNDSIKKQIETCELSCDNFVDLHNAIGYLFELNAVDFHYLCPPSRSLDNLHSAILESKDTIFRPNSKLIGHSFHIQFIKDLAATFMNYVKQGLFTSKDAAIELGTSTRERYQRLVEQEIGPQIESICMGNDVLQEKLIETWQSLESDVIKNSSPNKELFSVANAKIKAS